MDFPHPINLGRELPEVTVRSPASQDRMVTGARWARGGPGVGWVSSGGTFGPSLPLTKVIIFRLSTLCSIKVWVFKIQLVKHKPLKYNTIFVSLFGTFFFFKSTRSLKIMKVAQFCLLLGKQTALVLDKKSEAQRSPPMPELFLGTTLASLTPSGSNAEARSPLSLKPWNVLQ